MSESGDTIYAKTQEQGRVVSKAPIQFIEPSLEESQDLDFSNLMSKSEEKKPKNILQEQDNKYYFQVRLNDCEHDNPRICFGVCRETFLVN